MFNNTFYPTPETIANKMLEGIGLILPLNPKKEDDIKQYSEYVEMIKASL